MSLNKIRKCKKQCIVLIVSLWASMWVISTWESNFRVPMSNANIHRRLIGISAMQDLYSKSHTATPAETDRSDDINIEVKVDIPYGMGSTTTHNDSTDDIDIIKDEKDNAVKPQTPSDMDYADNSDEDLKYDNEEESFGYRKEMFRDFRRLKQSRVDCKALMAGDKNALGTARKTMKTQKRSAVPLKTYTRIVDCDFFKRTRGYILELPVHSEKEFPLAYAIIAYRDVEQVERLLRAIYRPHNYYCLHIDIKSEDADVDAFKSIASCFENVYLVRNPANVTWGGFSVLEAELLCMKLLWPYKTWKYYINLTGQEFPLRTNLEIVEILKAMKGANIADGTSLRSGNKDLFRWTLAGSRPPHNIKLVKGSVHVAVNRDFIDFCLHDYRSHDFQEWLKKTEIPDETFFASLNHNPHLGIAGSFLGSYEESPTKPVFIRYKKWQSDDETGATWCKGKYVRGICVIGVGDLQKLGEHPGLFVNKLYLEFEYLALDCLEEVILQKTYEQYENGGAGIDISFYKNIDQVKYQLKKKTR